jgi:putative ABC transport system permease protein
VVKAVHPEAIYMYASDVVEGRYLNQADIDGHRQVAVIGSSVRDFLFAPPADAPPGTPPSDPIGQWIDVGKFAFEVVGVFTDQGGEEEERQIYVPVSTAQLVFHDADHLGALTFTVGDASAAQAKQIIDTVVGELAAAHHFDPSDQQAVRVFNNVESYERFQNIFLSISIFVLVVGCGTLAAGVVGVSNIMMIAVKERTKEIGVRKALGATPMSIIAMIVQEAVFLTSISGLFGLVVGVAVLETIPKIADTDMIQNPSVDLRIGVLAALGLVVAGAVAGFVPARAAARVNPVHALRDQ